MNVFDLNLRGNGSLARPADSMELLEKLAADKLIHIKESTIGLAVLGKGTISGRPSVAFRIDLPDGQVVVFETTLRVFLTAADAVKAVWGSEAS